MYKSLKSSHSAVYNSGVRPSNPNDLLGYIDLIASVKFLYTHVSATIFFLRIWKFIALNFQEMKGASHMFFI